MDFTNRKLPRNAASDLRRLPLGELQPFAFMFSPVYVFLKRNEKFIGIKAPLDFFVQAEIEKVQPYGTLYVTPFVDQVAPFRAAGRRVKKILSGRAQAIDRDEIGYPEVKLPPPPWEVSDTVLGVVGPLWGRDLRIEPFFATAFVQDFCGSLPESLLLNSRDADILMHEKAIFRSTWAVFLALHLGLCDLDWLKRLRTRVFAIVSEQTVPASAGADRDPPDIAELLKLADSAVFDDEGIQPLNGDAFQYEDFRLALKINSRLERVKKEFAPRSTYKGSVRGKKGFLLYG
jgi:hypothetical protein